MYYCGEMPSRWRTERRTASQVILEYASSIGGKSTLSRKLGRAPNTIHTTFRDGRRFSYAMALDLRRVCGVPVCAVMERDDPINECVWRELAATGRILPRIYEAIESE